MIILFICHAFHSCCAYMKIVVYQTERMNLKNAIMHLNGLHKEEFTGNTLIVMPEKWIKDVIDMGSADYNDLMSVLGNISKETGCTIVPGSISLRENGKVYNAAPLFYKGQLTGWQRKISLFKNENETYEKGNEIRSFQIGTMKLGIAVCYDIDFPYYAKKLVSEGCDIIVNPSLIHSGFTDMWHLYIRSRSLENRVPIISVNSLSEPFLGNSIAVEPYRFDFGSKIREYMCGSDHMTVFSINPEETAQIRTDRFREDPGSYGLASESQDQYSS